MKIFAILLLFLILQGRDAVIYRLNDEDYARMPPLMHMDSVGECQLDAEGIYCMAEFGLVSDKPSLLLDMIKEYSEHDVSHYDHTKLRYGICVKHSCKTFYEKSDGDLVLTLEACLNDSMSKTYDLKVNVLDEYNCKPPGKSIKKVDTLDMIVGAICAIIIATNLIGSLYDIFRNENNQGGAFRFLLCFSLKRNWKQLMASAGENRDPRLKLLKGIHGMRVLTTFLVIIGHDSLVSMILIDNPDQMEWNLTVKPLSILMNGTLIMQTFLIISSFLLVYNWLLYKEKHQVSWYMLPKYIMIRWFRITPTLALTLALTSTWYGHLTHGPLWEKYVRTDMNDCRRDWWKNVLFINNFFPHSQCMALTWYLAADTQLYCLAVVLLLMCKTTRSRILTFTSLLLVGIILSAVIVYLKELDGIQMITPESTQTFLVDDPHFIHIYTQSYTNVGGYMLGMSMGFLVYHWQKNGVQLQKYQTIPYRLLYRSLFFIGMYCCYSGYIFYSDAPRQSVFVRMVYVAFLKPIFGLCMCGIIVGLVFQFEDLYRGILEWRGWTVFSRLSFCAYLLHMSIMKIQLASKTQTSMTSIFQSIEDCANLLVITFAASLLLWLLVEAPFSNIVNECLSKPKVEIEEKKKVYIKTKKNSARKKEFKLSSSNK